MADLELPDAFRTKVYAGPDRTTLVGHLQTAIRVTNRNLYSMVEIACIFSQPFDWHIQDARGSVVWQDEEALQPGDFFVISPGRFLFFQIHYSSLLTQSR